MDQELSRPISYEFWKEVHKDSMYKVSRSFPDQFPIDFERDSLRIPYVNWQGAFQPNFQWILKRIPYGFHM